MTATLGWLHGPGGTDARAEITVEAACTRTDWSQARRLLLEYVEAAVAAVGARIADVAPRHWREVWDPSSHFSGPEHRMFLASRGGGAVGIAGLHFDGDSAEIVRMYVRPEYRRRGIGGALLEALRQEAVRYGACRLRLETYPPGMASAFRLYQRSGFRIVGTHPLCGVDFVDMELELRPPP